MSNEDMNAVSEALGGQKAQRTELRKHHVTAHEATAARACTAFHSIALQKVACLCLADTSAFECLGLSHNTAVTAF